MRADSVRIEMGGTTKTTMKKFLPAYEGTLFTDIRKTAVLQHFLLEVIDVEKVAG